jgi:hypothetical protein
MHGVGASVPLSPEEVEGWRAWSVVERDGRYLLSSLTRAEVWEPGEPFSAACSRKPHDAPGRRCSCGVYAAADANELARLGRIAGAAIGQVSLWGRLVEHSRGYRASCAYPGRLRLVCVSCLSEGYGMPAAVVDEDTSGGRTRLRPLCERHASGRPLPAAAPVEAELLAAYRVDVLPDATVHQIVRPDAQRRRSSRIAALAAAATIAVSVVVGAVAVTRHRAQEVSASVPLPPPGLVAHAGRQGGPAPRTGDGLRTVTHAKLSALSPFPTVHCGTLTETGVAPTLSCADPASDVFVENVGPAAEHRFGTCSDHTVAVSQHGDRLLCWRALSVTADAP